MNDEAVNSVEGESSDDRQVRASADQGAERVERREALKRAAAAAGVAGAVWAAPRIEGLSLAPDYAAAATATGNMSKVVFGIGTTDGIGPLGGVPSTFSTYFNLGSGCNPGGDHWFTVLGNGPSSGTAVQIVNRGDRIPAPAGGPYTVTNTSGGGPGTVSVSGDTYTKWTPVPTPVPSTYQEPGTIYIVPSSALTLSAPLGTGIGNVSVTLPTSNAGGSDLEVARRFDVAFAGIDPPFNKCRVTKAALQWCETEPNSTSNNAYLNSYSGGGPVDYGGNVANTAGPSPTPGAIWFNHGPGINPTNFNNNLGSWNSTITINSTTAPGSDGRAVRWVQIEIDCV